MILSAFWGIFCGLLGRPFWTSLHHHYILSLRESCIIYPYPIPIDVVKIARMSTSCIPSSGSRKKKEWTCRRSTLIHLFIHSYFLSLFLPFCWRPGGHEIHPYLQKIDRHKWRRRCKQRLGKTILLLLLIIVIIISTVESLLHQLPTHQIHWKFGCNWLLERVGYVKLMTLLIGLNFTS